MIKKHHICVALFLSVIVVADLIVAHFGPSILPYTAFFLIPFDLLTRDILHEEWKGPMLWPKIGGLILAGGLIAYILNRDALMVAAASITAFTAATIVNTAVYAKMESHPVMVKMNVSNFFAAITDSIIFPYIAFGVLPFHIMLQQSTAKFVGGLVWSFLYTKLFLVKKSNHFE